MKRRMFLVISLSAALAGTGASAQSMQDRVISQLQEQGFTEIRISRTWLRRVRIVARSATQRREIIFNPSTGEILRDLWQLSDDGDREGHIVSSGGEGYDDDYDDDDHSGHGGGGHDDDDDDDDDHDNSGPGGGGRDDD